MSIATEQIIQKAIRLSPYERAELIDKLYHTFDNENNREIDMLWAEESESRLDGYEQGKIKSYPIEDVYKELNEKL